MPRTPVRPSRLRSCPQKPDDHRADRRISLELAVEANGRMRCCTVSRRMELRECRSPWKLKYLDLDLLDYGIWTVHLTNSPRVTAISAPPVPSTLPTGGQRHPSGARDRTASEFHLDHVVGSGRGRAINHHQPTEFFPARRRTIATTGARHQPN